MTADNLSDATWVAGLLAVSGKNLGGALVSENVADEFMAAYRAAVGPEGGLRVVSSSMTAEALTGSMDLATTLALGRPMYSEGLLTTNPILWVRRAERLDAACSSLLSHALDHRQILLMAVIDENDSDAVPPAKLEDRLPFRVFDQAEVHWTRDDIKNAQDIMVQQPLAQNFLEDLCNAAFAVGISSPRTLVQAIATARAVAALRGQEKIDQSAIALAARLVLAHRATHAPPDDEEQTDQSSPPPDPEETETQNDTPQTPSDAEVILDAVKAAIPANLLNALADGIGKRAAGRNLKSADQRKLGGKRGRRIGNKRASSLAGQRLDILATLRCAAPWQPLRRKMADTDRMVITRDDFRVARIKQRNEGTAIFAVDASGSTAFQRLAEAKGAVETILADCYVRRDRVALVSFRSKKAEVFLPPTRSLERAKRALASLAGGGGTPLATGLDETYALAMLVRRAGGNPIIILLTDGRGNVTRSGEGNRAKATEEALSAARQFAAEGLQSMIIDVSAEQHKSAKILAENMKAKYLAMPRATASDIALPVSMALKSVSA